MLLPGLRAELYWEKPDLIVRKDVNNEKYGGSKASDATGTSDLGGCSEVFHDDRIWSKVSCVTNSFKDIKAIEDKNNVRIWIVKLLSTETDEECKVCNVLVHWYETWSD